MEGPCQDVCVKSILVGHNIKVAKPKLKKEKLVFKKSFEKNLLIRCYQFIFWDNHYQLPQRLLSERGVKLILFRFFRRACVYST